jgi:hypothetical protein
MMPRIRPSSNCIGFGSKRLSSSTCALASAPPLAPELLSNENEPDASAELPEGGGDAGGGDAGAGDAAGGGDAGAAAGGGAGDAAGAGVAAGAGAGCCAIDNPVTVAVNSPEPKPTSVFAFIVSPWRKNKALAKASLRPCGPRGTT